MKAIGNARKLSCAGFHANMTLNPVPHAIVTGVALVQVTLIHSAESALLSKTMIYERPSCKMGRAEILSHWTRNARVRKILIATHDVMIILKRYNAL